MVIELRERTEDHVRTWFDRSGEAHMLAGLPRSAQTAEQALAVVERYRSEGKSLKEACKLASADTGFAKNELYNMALGK